MCDDLDNDCDEVVDDDPADGDAWFPDRDGDGWGELGESTYGCGGTMEDSGYVLTDGDCDDSDESVYPGAPEVCDDQDNDCDGEVDEDAPGTAPYYLDEDGDGYGMSDTYVTACAEPEGYSSESGDCDDSDVDRNPGMEDGLDGVDNDCDDVCDEDGAPGSYNVRISEFMAYVDAPWVDSSLSAWDLEWIEIANYGTSTVGLCGWALSDQENSVKIPGGFILGPGAREVIAHSTYVDSILGVSIGGAYGSWEAYSTDDDAEYFRLDNDDDEITLSIGDPDTGVVVHQVDYESTWSLKANTARQLDMEGTSEVWCDSTSDFYCSGDGTECFFGTPGKTNEDCGS